MDHEPRNTQQASHGPQSVPPEATFVPDWGQLEKLWMGRMPYTSFVERNEYAIGFAHFRQQTELRIQVDLLTQMIDTHRPGPHESLADPTVAIRAVIAQQLEEQRRAITGH